MEIERISVEEARKRVKEITGEDAIPPILGTGKTLVGDVLEPSYQVLMADYRSLPGYDQVVAVSIYQNDVLVDRFNIK